MTIEKEFLEVFARAAREIGLSLSDSQLALFGEFRRELLLWNAKTNLVSLRGPLDLPIKHFADSLLAARFIEKPDGRLLDIGTGAGFPGIPLKIALEELSVSLLDSSRKKTSFLKHVIGRLRLERAEVIHGRIEQIAAEVRYMGAFDTVISRATFKLPELVASGAPFLAGGGTLIAMKGKGFEPELEEAQTVSEAFGLSLSGVHLLPLPTLGDKRIIIVFSKS